MLKGWILYKHNPENSYESNRFVEEFKREDIDVDIINPNDIDIFVNKEFLGKSYVIRLYLRPVVKPTVRGRNVKNAFQYWFCNLEFFAVGSPILNDVIFVGPCHGTNVLYM